MRPVRRSENRKRGYEEVKTPLIYDKAVWITSGHWEKFRENMFLVAGEGEEPHAGLKPMKLRLVRFDPEHKRASSKKWTHGKQALNQFSDD